MGKTNLPNRKSLRLKRYDYASEGCYFITICTKTINKEQKELFFAWHTRFHDHIVRNEKALNAIRKYIVENPIKWLLDRENDNGMYSKFNFKNVDEINDFNIKKYTK